MGKWILFVALCSALGCQPLKGAKTSEFNQELLRAEMGAQVASSKTVWESSGKPASNSYSFKFKTKNLAGRKITVRIVVTKGEFTEVEQLRGSRLTNGDVRALLKLNLSVEGLLANIEAGLNTQCVPYVRFDREKGFPRSLRATCAAGEAAEYTISDLEVE